MEESNHRVYTLQYFICAKMSPLVCTTTEPAPLGGSRVDGRARGEPILGTTY